MRTNLVRPNLKFKDVDDLMIAKVLQYYAEPPAEEYRRAMEWDILSYWALGVLVTFVVTLAYL